MPWTGQVFLPLSHRSHGGSTWLAVVHMGAPSRVTDTWGMGALLGCQHSRDGSTQGQEHLRDQSPQGQEHIGDRNTQGIGSTQGQEYLGDWEHSMDRSTHGMEAHNGMRDSVE